MNTDKYLSISAMREADRRAIEELGIPGAVLMNNAGAAVYEALGPGRVGIVCGKGNNGGDGFVVARLALEADREVSVVLLADKSEISGDASVFMRAFERMGGQIEVVTTEDEVTEAMARLATCDVLVDAMLGTGVTGPARGIYAAAIEAWPQGPRTVAVDLPSGMNGDTGEAEGPCIQAHTTITLAFAKRGFQNPAAAALLGKLIVAPIGIPTICADDEAWAALRSSWS